MSKKYKLIKDYPSSPQAPIGTIFEYDIQTGNFFAEGGWYVHPRFVVNYPEFWEPLFAECSHCGNIIYPEKKEDCSCVEKDYEILSFTNRDIKSKVSKHPLYVLKEDGLYHYVKETSGYPPSKSTEKDNLNDVGIAIYSIRRLSDGEVFTVGNRVRHEVKGFDNKHLRYNNWTINEFRLIDGKIRCYSGTGFNININDLEHRKQPFFITEDGKKIFEGDSYSFIEPYTFYAQASIAPDKNDWKHNTMRFSTREKAEKWIEDNKPKYSKNNVIEMVDKSLDLYPRIICSKEGEYIISLDKLKKQLNSD